MEKEKKTRFVCVYPIIGLKALNLGIGSAPIFQNGALKFFYIYLYYVPFFREIIIGLTQILIYHAYE